MKFIGQYIQDFIARFRSDVYLEDISTGTIASGANLGLDSNNKIVKNTVSGGTTDLTSDVTGVLPIANGGTNSNSAADARTALGVDAAGTDNSTNVTLTGTPDYITISGQEITRNQIDLANDVTGTLAAGNVATLNQDTTGNAATADALTSGNKTIAGNVTVEVSTNPLLAFKRTGTGSDDNLVGTIRFTGNNDADEVIRYAAIDGKVNDASDGAEEGKLTLSVSSHDGEMQPGVTITSGDAEDEVDVTIGNEATSVTTIAGTLTMGSTATLNNSGLIQVANQSNITGVGTLASGNATAIVDAASDTAAGKVELATTAEADTGTDTSRAVTPASLKSHVASPTSYYAPNNQGAFNTGWTATGISGGVDYFVDGTDQVVFFKQNGIIVPAACTLVSMRGYVRYGVSKSYKFKFLQLAAGDIKYNTNGTVQATKICESSVTFTDNNTSRYAPMSFDGSVSLAQGDMLIPMIKNTDGDYSANTHFSFSFSIKV